MKENDDKDTDFSRETDVKDMVPHRAKKYSQETACDQEPLCFRR